MDFSNDLNKRTFETYDFYRKLQDNISPAGLAFFQSDYDTNLKEFYHNVLGMKEPIFVYDFPKAYHPPEKHFPLKQAFNLYLDRYRDPKTVSNFIKRIVLDFFIKTFEMDFYFHSFVFVNFSSYD